MNPPSRCHDERFWSLVDKSADPLACWVWIGGKSRGYGTVRVAGRRSVRAHRLAWELTHGSIPPGIKVCHNCPGGDNPSCVNPAHLWLGDQRANIEDMVSKGRQARGARQGIARLSEQSVHEIRRLRRAAGLTQKELAHQFGVSTRAIRSVLSGRTWGWLNDPLAPASFD